MAYPSNAVDQRSAAITEAAGYDFAFAGERRVASLPVAARFAIRRLPVALNTEWLFRAQLQQAIAALGATLTDLRSGSASKPAGGTALSSAASS